MASTRFRPPKSLSEQSSLLKDVTPQNTKNSTKWAVKIFEQWQQARANKKTENETVALEARNCRVENVQELSCKLEVTTAETVNFWLSKFIGEVTNQCGGRYPPKTVYLLACGINRYLADVKSEDYFNILAKDDRRFRLFRSMLDAEMKDVTRCGITQMTKKEDREEITEAEEALMWDKALLGATTAESLLHTVYFYNGKVFGLRTGEHRLLRMCNISVQDNMIIFDESLSKTYHGGLKDVTKKPRYVKHMCHRLDETHEPCLVSMYALYLSKVKDFAESLHAFYFRPHRSGRFEYEKGPLGICTLSKILPEKLCERAGLKRKTAHCLRITCASRLFQNSVDEKLARERTGHSSNALFKYQNPSKEQVENVSEILGPCIDRRNNSCTDVKGITDSTVAAIKGEQNLDISLSDLFDLLSLSDEELANMAMPVATTVPQNICTSSVFNNCTINFVVNSK